MIPSVLLSTTMHGSGSGCHVGLTRLLESYQILCSLSGSHHGLVNRNDHLSAAEFEFVVVGRQPMGIAQINLSVRGQEEKLNSPWLMSGHISDIQSYGIPLCLCDLPN